MKNTEKTMDKIVALCKNRGFIFAGSEIYGGLANTWDYGPLGVELKNNVKKAWWKKFVQENPYNVGQDAAILMNPQTWVASGHLSGFSDPLMDCRECKERFRADKLIEDWCQQASVELPKPIDAFTQQEMKDFIEEHNIPCPSCGKHNFTDIRQFNLMFKTFQGVTEDAKNTVYLRPETAQGIFTNFVNTQRTTRRKLPFGVCQIGKSFRNEITPGNFIFRVREFEQMELEFFCKPGTDLEWFQYWRTFCHNWLLSIGLKDENLRLRDHDPEELCFYSKATTDFEFLFPFGWGELWGVADRTDYDLTQHQNTSGKDLTYFDPETNQRYIPYVVEPSLGVERSVLAVLCDAYDEEVVGQDKNGKDDVRVVLHLHPALAPYKAAILPLSKKLSEPAMEIYNDLCKDFMLDFDETGSIGKRYRREDEIGTPFCITVDFDTVGDGENPGDHCVTVLDHGVHQLLVAHASAPAGVQGGEGSGAHVLGAAADHHVGITGQDGAGALDDRLHAGAADHAHGVSGNGIGDTGLDGHLAGNVLALGSGQDAAEHNLIHVFGGDIGALEGLLHHHCAHLGGRGVLQGTAEGADSGTAAIDDIQIFHSGNFLLHFVLGFYSVPIS